MLFEEQPDVSTDGAGVGTSAGAARSECVRQKWIQQVTLGGSLSHKQTD